MKNLLRAGAVILGLAATTLFPTTTSAYTAFSPDQIYIVHTDGYGISCVYNSWDQQIWNSDYHYWDFYYVYGEPYTNQWNRHWLYDLEDGRWTYCNTINYENFN